MTKNGAVDLYHNGSKTFEPTSDGSKVTGELDVHKSGTGDVFHVQGNGTGAVVAKVENAYNSDNDRFAILELKSGKGSIRFNSNGDSNEGAITYNMADNTMVFGVNNASEKLRIQSGGGISFNGDTAAANALNDYEEGTFTLAASAMSVSNSNCKYVKIGRLVYCTGTIDNGTSGNGALVAQFSGLPFAGQTGCEDGKQGGTCPDHNVGQTIFTALVSSSNMRIHNDTGSHVTQSVVDDKQINFNITYYTT